MTFIKSFVFVLIISAFSLTTLYAQTDAKDVQAVKDIAAKYEKSWNEHDMDAMFDLFTEDSDWVNIVGMHWKGRSDSKKAHQIFHDTMFKNTPLKIDEVYVRKITKDTAVAVLTISMGDFATPAGDIIKSSKDRMSLFMVKQKGRWLIAHGHNTAIDLRAVANDPIKN